MMGLIKSNQIMQKMKRREFLQALAVITSGAMVKANIPVNLPRSGEVSLSDKFRVVGRNNIEYIGDGEERFTVLEFHRWLMDEADKQMVDGSDVLDILSECPSIRHTDHTIELSTNYNITTNVVEHLTGGTLVHGDDIYTSVFTWPEMKSPIETYFV